MDKQSLNSHTEIAHRAIQLITKAAKSWLPEKADDSHTNQAWNINSASFSGHPFENGVTIEVGLLPLQLIIRQNNSIVHEFSLAGQKHSAIEQKMVDALSTLGFDSSKWVSSLHFELPYSELEEFVYPSLDNNAMKAVADLRSFAQNVFTTYEAKHKVDLGLRTWPHHFDLGGLSVTAQDEDGNATSSIGMGTAMQDEGTDEHYFYINHWKQGGIDSYPNPTALPNSGYWLGNVPMAILRISNSIDGDEYNAHKAAEFIEQAVKESARFLVLS